MSVAPPVIAGIVTNPIVQVQLNNASSPIGMSLSDLIDAAFGSVAGQSIYRGSNGWSTSTAKGPYAITFIKAGELADADDVAPWQYVPTNMTATLIAATVKTAPVGASIIGSVQSSTDGTTFGEIATFTIADAGKIYSNIVSIVIPAFTVVRLDVTQVGSGTAGSDLTVTLFGTAAQ